MPLVVLVRLVTSRLPVVIVNNSEQSPNLRNSSTKNYISLINSYQDFQRLNNKPFDSVELTPRAGLLLDVDERLQLNGLVLNGRLTLSNVRSFNAFYNPFKQIRHYRFDMTIQNSTFAFFSSSFNQTDSSKTFLLDECSFCSHCVGEQELSFVFANLNIVELTLDNVRFDQPVCPYLFNNSRITNLIVIDAKGAFGFVPIRERDKVDLLLNVHIYQFGLNYTVNNLDQPQWLDSESILTYSMFKNPSRFNINSAPR